MANEFIARKGVISLDNSIISGNLNVTSFLTASGLNYPSADNGEFSFIQTDGNGNLSLQYVNTLYEIVYNGEATQLDKGTPVYISGSQGANSVAYRADAGNPSKMPVVYVAADNIASADTGRAIALGLITGVDTTGYPGGTEIYVGVGGGWTSTRPTGSAIVQVLGYVTKEGAGGQGVVLNPGPANLPNLPSGSVWLGNSGSVPIAVSSASLFVNSASFASTASFVRNAISSSYLSGSNVIASYITASNGFRVSTGNLTIGSQIIYPQGSDGFSVNESFNVGNSTQTAYHFTSGDPARTSVVFSLARTSNFTNMFGITGSSTDNKFVIGAETSNTDFEWRTGLGVAPVKLQGGNLLARLDRSGSLYVSRSVSASSFTGSLQGTASYANNANSASYALTASYALNGGGGGTTDTGSLLKTASVNLNTITFTKGDGSTFPITVDTGSGGGGGVTINNNVDNYVITATGTANTLNGEVGLRYSSSVLINRGRSRFGDATVDNTTHQFRATGSDSYAGFLLIDPDGEETFRMAGSMANGDLLLSMGDINDAYNTTKITVDDPNSKITLEGKIYGDAYATNATALAAVGTYDIGSKLATQWAVAGGPALTAGRVVYLSGSAQWDQAQANVSGSSYGMLGVVTDAESQNEVLIEGTIQISGSALSSGIAGQPIYLSAATAGEVTLTAPTASNNVVRIIGYITKANSNVMYFRPDTTFTVVA